MPVWWAPRTLGRGVGGVDVLPLGVDELAGRVGPLVGVGAEEIALGLDQVARQALAAVAVVVGQARAEGRRADAVGDRLVDHAPPGILARVDLLLEVLVHQQVGQVRVLLEGLR